MSTADQKLASEIHGTALRLAQDERLQPLLDQLAQVAGGREDLRTQEAGILAGTWYAAPGRHLGHELIAAGLLILAGVTDRDQLEEAVRVGYERGKGSLQGYDPSGQHVGGYAGPARLLPSHAFTHCRTVLIGLSATTARVRGAVLAPQQTYIRLRSSLTNVSTLSSWS